MGKENTGGRQIPGEDQIEKRQLSRMMFIEGFGAAGLTFPAVAAWGSRSEGLWPVLVYGVFFFLFIFWMLWIIWRLEKRNPEKMAEGYGLVLNKPLGMLYLVRLFVNALALFYFFGISIQKIYMPDMSLLKILLPFAVLLWYCTQTTLQKRARFLELLFPWIVALFFTLIVFSFLGLEGEFRLPPLQEDLALACRNGYFLLLCTTPLEFLLFLVPAVTGKQGGRQEEGETWWKKRNRLVIKTAAGIFLWDVLLWFVTVESLGGKLTASSPWPVIKIMQLIHLPGGFLERFDILLAVFWILCLAGVLSGYLYYGRKIAEEVFFTPVRKEEKLRINMAKMTGGVVLLLLGLSCFFLDGQEEFWRNLFIFYKKWVDFPLLLLLPLLALLSHFPRRLVGMAILCVGMLSLFGCQNHADVEEKSYVLSLYVEDSGENYTYWVSRADLAAMEEKEDSIPCVTTRFIAKNLNELESKFEKTEVGTLEWNHIETIFLGPNLINNGPKTSAFLQEWEASWQKSPNVLLSVCKEGAEELLKIKNIPEGAAGQEVSRLMEQAEQSPAPSAKATDRCCRTPVEVLRAKNAGEKEIYLYETSVENKRLVLKRQKQAKLLL